MSTTDQDREVAAELVDAWQASGKAYDDLTDRIAEALAGARRDATPQSRQRCPECGAGEIDVHRRDCSSKQGPPLADGGIPWGGACDTPGCRYADQNVRHVHRAEAIR